MKFNYLIKATPLLSTLLLIIFLNINNQKEYTKLRILIWDTPLLRLSTYLSISTGSGFLISYFLTTNIAKSYQLTPKQSLKFKVKRLEDENNDNSDTVIDTSYDNTLIERDIKDPSPTINASFRVIGRREKSNNDYINNNNNSQYDDSFEFEESFHEQVDEIPTNNQVKASTDWYDESYSRW